jgi:hypothetical protein
VHVLESKNGVVGVKSQSYCALLQKQTHKSALYIGSGVPVQSEG